MELSEEINDMARGLLADESQFIVDVIVSSKRGPKKVLIIVDGDRGVTIDDCAELSRRLSKVLDESNRLDEQYTLEVSTPGIDQPLKLKRQYKKNIGRGIKVKLKDKLVEGMLSAVADETITLTQRVSKGKDQQENAITVPFGEIEKAFVTISFK